MAQPSVVIFLHGLGDSGSGWANLRSDLGLGPHVQWQFPDAPMGRSTCNDGDMVRQWFDIVTLPLIDGEAHPGFAGAVAQVHQLLRQVEAQGIPPERTVLGGFSQGGTLALAAGLSTPRPLAGIISCSGWAAPELIGLIKHRNTPICLTHGSADQLIPHSAGQRLIDTLRRAGCSNVQTKTHHGVQHQVPSEHYGDLAAFLRATLPPAGTSQPGSLAQQAVPAGAVTAAGFGGRPQLASQPLATGAAGVGGYHAVSGGSGFTMAPQVRSAGGVGAPGVVGVFGAPSVASYGGSTGAPSYGGRPMPVQQPTSGLGAAGVYTVGGAAGGCATRLR